MDNPTFHHWGNAGDIIYSLPSIADLTRRAGAEQAILYLEIDHPAFYSANVKHPLGKVCLNREYADRLIPLLLAQPYIADVRIWNGETVNFNLNWFRGVGFNHGAGDITKWYRHVFKCNPCTWQPWLFVDPDPAYQGCILVNRTNRYRNPNLDYSFLKRYESRLIFIGLTDEYQDFRSAFDIRVPVRLPLDYLKTARAIAACRLYIGNQSSCFALAEGLKVPRVLEVAPHAPNVIPQGGEGWEVISQNLFESIVADLASAT